MFKKVSKVILVVGPSQSGKRSVINMIGGNSAVGKIDLNFFFIKFKLKGSGNGLSETTKVNWKITEECPLYLKKIVLIIDTVGFDDTNLKIHEEILLEIKQFML